MIPIAFGIVRDQFPPEKLSISQGIFTAMFGAGVVLGLAVGGTIVAYYGWRITFFSILPVVVVLLFLIIKFIQDKRFSY